MTSSYFLDALLKRAMSYILRGRLAMVTDDICPYLDSGGQNRDAGRLLVSFYTVTQYRNDRDASSLQQLTPSLSSRLPVEITKGAFAFSSLITAAD